MDVVETVSLYVCVLRLVFCGVRAMNRAQTSACSMCGSGSIHDLGTTFGTKELRTMSHWILTFITICYYLINKIEINK